VSIAPRVYSYLRFSDARQADGASSERQAAYAAEWARQHGLQLDATLSMRDEGLSAYHQRHITRGALGVFLAAVEAGQVPQGSVLVVEGLDRLSRAEPLHAQAQLASIITAGVTVVTASDGRAYSRESLKAQPMDLVYSLLVMIRAHEESDTKSKRVRDAIRRQVLGWKAGTYRGLIRYGQAPAWLRAAGGRWELVDERVAAIRAAAELARQGVGLGEISRRLHAGGMAWSAATPTSGHLSRLLTHRALVGEKLLQLDGQEHVLEGYYPAVFEPASWAALQESLARRTRGPVASEIPSILTGMGITSCGYCGAPLKAQNMASKRRDDGSLADGHRRLQCSRNNSGERCPVPGSCSAAPVERALVRFCSDLVNLQGLYQGDATVGPRAVLAQARQRQATLEQQLQRVTDALATDVDEPPAAFVRRARELETELASARAAVASAEAEVASAARADLTGADARWRSIAAGIEALDVDARLQARQLVAETFARIVVYRAGLRPGQAERGIIDVVLHARGGSTRLLRVQGSGDWVAGEDLALPGG
jgi:DNA invertase Pin-like site-specific DNA recombinase